MAPFYEEEQAGENREPVSLRERSRTFFFSRYFIAAFIGIVALVLVVFVTKNLHSSKATAHDETDVNHQELLHKEGKPFQADVVVQKGEIRSSAQKHALEHWTKKSHALPGAEVTILEEKRDPAQVEETFFSSAGLERASAPMRERERLLASGDPNRVLAINIHGVPLTESLF
ncbi:MAG: hypothetical protein ABW096_06785 [Candidatus Thiodiazotropha sp.]